MSDLDSPVFKKRAKARPGSAARDGSGAEPELAADASPDTLAAKVKKASRVKPKSRLSFGADEDEVRRRSHRERILMCALSAQEGAGDKFQVKKSALSRKVKAASPLCAKPAARCSALTSP